MSIARYNPKFKYFQKLDNIKTIKDYYEICTAFNFNYVIKPVGLCSGKGVKLSILDHFDTDLEGFIYSLECINNNQSVLIEEKLEGNEYTLMTYTDGNSFSHMPIVIDFKRLNENNTGPNTGSMGCISYSNHKAPFLSEYDIEESKRINEEVIKTLQQTGETYKGIIYGSFIKCYDTHEIKIIEYNCRYGDPECINVLELLNTDLNKIFESIINQNLHTLDITYAKQNIVSKYIVPTDYSKNTITLDNTIINFNNNWITSNRNNIIFSSVNIENHILSTTKSRTMIYFITSKKDVNSISQDINYELNILMNLCNNSLKYRKDIGIQKTINYKDSGVDIDKADSCFKAIKNHISYTNNDTVVSKLNDFSGMISIKKYLNAFNGYMEPVLVSSIDGVGTKTSFLYRFFGDEAFNIVGRDIVNHCVNDVLTKGAKPLFFLDYVASSNLNINHIEKIVKYMSLESKKHDCPLIGGETAEMPNIYYRDEIDIVGCMVGIVDKQNIINGKELITTDDIIIGFPSHLSSHFGFSLI